MGEPRSNSCRGEVFIPFPERPVRLWGPLGVLFDEYRSTFSGVKRSGRVANPLAQSNTKYHSYNSPYPISLHSADRFDIGPRAMNQGDATYPTFITKLLVASCLFISLHPTLLDARTQEPKTGIICFLVTILYQLSLLRIYLMVR